MPADRGEKRAKSVFILSAPTNPHAKAQSSQRKRNFASFAPLRETDFVLTLFSSVNPTLDYNGEMDASAAKRRWYHPTPGWLVYAAVVATWVLLVAERLRWFPTHYQKGWPVLLAVAIVAAVFLVTLAWMLVALVFGRRVKLCLQTRLAFVILCAVVFSWLVVRIVQARRQAEAVRVITSQLSGIVYYDWELDATGRWQSRPWPPAPKPLSILLDVQFFGDVDVVRFVPSSVDDARLAPLAVLTQLRSLRLDSDQVTDAALSHLEGLTNLRELWLANTKVTDEGAKNLKRVLPGCEIYIGNTRR
jgi:hypothetical protein